MNNEWYNGQLEENVHSNEALSDGEVMDIIGKHPESARVFAGVVQLFYQYHVSDGISFLCRMGRVLMRRMKLFD